MATDPLEFPEIQAAEEERDGQYHRAGGEKGECPQVETTFFFQRGDENIMDSQGFSPIFKEISPLVGFQTGFLDFCALLKQS